MFQSRLLLCKILFRFSENVDLVLVKRRQEANLEWLVLPTRMVQDARLRDKQPVLFIPDEFKPIAVRLVGTLDDACLFE